MNEGTKLGALAKGEAVSDDCVSSDFGETYTVLFLVFTLGLASLGLVALVAMGISVGSWLLLASGVCALVWWKIVRLLHQVYICDDRILLVKNGRRRFLRRGEITEISVVPVMRPFPVYIEFKSDERVERAYFFPRRSRWGALVENESSLVRLNQWRDER